MMTNKVFGFFCHLKRSCVCVSSGHVCEGGGLIFLHWLTVIRSTWERESSE